MNGLLEALIVEVLIPEIANAVRTRPDITDAEILAELERRRARILTKGRAFLAEPHPTKA